MRVIESAYLDGYEVGIIVSSESDPRDCYFVSIELGTGICECDCKDWQFRRRGLDILKSCKHIRFVAREAERIQRNRKDSEEL